MKILITGGGGFLGRRMVEPFEKNPGCKLRLMDVVPVDSQHEVFLGDVSHYDDVARAVEGMDAIIIAHMAPRGEGDINYRTPRMPFDINVKGTANLLHAAVEAGIQKVVLISSKIAISGYPWEGHKHTLSPKCEEGYYGMGKACQELIAEQFAREHGLQIAALRVGYVLDGSENVDKYGRPVTNRYCIQTDCRDIGEVARLALELEDLSYEVFHVMSTQESLTEWDVQHTCDRLGWAPKHDFSWLPESRERT